MQLAAVLCAAGALAFAPAPPERPDKILFTSMSADGKNIGVCAMNPDGSKRTTLSKEGALEIDPAFSPDGQRIVFATVSKDDMKGDLWVMAADGTGRKQLTQSKAKAIILSPSWSPDGKHILFTRMTVANGPPMDAELLVIDADGQNEKSLGKGLMGAWSPDDKQILYTTLEMGGDFEPRLTVMDADGKNSKQLFQTPSMMGSYSPDGKRITYMGAPSTKNTKPRIYVANADGSQAAQVTTAADAFELAPRWSPDGKRVLFNRSAERQNGPPAKATIVAIDPDGKNEKELTSGDGMDLLGGAALFLMERMAQPPKP